MVRIRRGSRTAARSKVHHHHAYWRFDFDIETAHNHLLREFNDPPLIGSSKWHSKNYEIRRMRDPSRKRRWGVTNKSSKRGYTIIRGSNDGVTAATPDWPFSAGDVWIVRYRGSELDDGQGLTTDPAKAKADIDKFVNGQSIDGRDVVIWYGAHFTHDEGGPQVSHIVGPDLKPYAW